MTAYDIVVIGGGPAGMMAAGTAAERGASVALMEKNQRNGKKLLITGKGRCNVTNDCTRDGFFANIPVCSPVSNHWNARFARGCCKADRPPRRFRFMEARPSREARALRKKAVLR